MATPASWNPPAGMPFTVSLAGPSLLHIVVQGTASADLSHLADAQSVKWLHGFQGTVQVDLGQLVTISSVICAWLLEMQREIRPGTIVLLNCSPRVRGNLRDLRLDRLLTIT